MTPTSPNPRFLTAFGACAMLVAAGSFGLGLIVGDQDEETLVAAVPPPTATPGRSLITTSTELNRAVDDEPDTATPPESTTIEPAQTRELELLFEPPIEAFVAAEGRFVILQVSDGFWIASVDEEFRNRLVPTKSSAASAAYDHTNNRLLVIDGREFTVITVDPETGAHAVEIAEQRPWTLVAVTALKGGGFTILNDNGRRLEGGDFQSGPDLSGWTVELAETVRGIGGGWYAAVTAEQQGDLKGLVLIDPDGQLHDCGKTSSDLIGIDREELVFVDGSVRDPERCDIPEAGPLLPNRVAVARRGGEAIAALTSDGTDFDIIALPSEADIVASAAPGTSLLAPLESGLLLLGPEGAFWVEL